MLLMLCPAPPPRPPPPPPPPGPAVSCVQYGKVLSIDMKAPVRPPAFAFVEYG